MARILNVHIPENKAVKIALTSIYGIGLSSALKICEDAEIDPNKKIKVLNEQEILKIRNLAQNYLTEGELKRFIYANIKRLKDISCYRGIRHRKGLPVRGQITQKNARTCKGPRKTVANKKKASQKT